MNNDENLMNIVNEVFDSESSDEDQSLFNNSDCISDCRENFIKISEKIVNNSQISALNITVRYIFLLFYGWYLCCMRVIYH